MFAKHRLQYITQIYTMNVYVPVCIMLHITTQTPVIHFYSIMCMLLCHHQHTNTAFSETHTTTCCRQCIVICVVWEKYISQQLVYTQSQTVTHSHIHTSPRPLCMSLHIMCDKQYWWCYVLTLCVCIACESDTSKIMQVLWHAMCVVMIPSVCDVCHVCVVCCIILLCIIKIKNMFTWWPFLLCLSLSSPVKTIHKNIVLNVVFHDDHQRDDHIIILNNVWYIMYTPLIFHAIRVMGI